MLRALALVALLAATPLVAAPLAGQAVHSHYEGLLEQGTYALESGEPAEAARLLRFACFGMLEVPPSLADCLTRLAVAQAAAGDDEGFSDTFRRLAEVEERFGGYTAAPIAAGMRAAFESEAAARVPARVLAATPVFARLVPAEGAAQESVTVPVRPLEPEAGPEAPAELAATGGSLDAEERARLERARALVAAATDRGQLEEPSRIAREVADANPTSREAQHLAAVIAYRAASWQDAVRYFRQGGDPGDTAPETLFYYAVSLYEAGEREEAAEVLRRGLPRLEPTPFVRSYEAKILGSAPVDDAALPGGS